MARSPTFRERTKPVPLVFEDTERTFADMPPLLVKNRFLERSVSSAGQENFVARPGSSVFTTVGTGPIRATYDLPGLFNGAQFVVSNQTLYRIETDGTIIPITGTIYGTGYVHMVGYQDPSNNRLFISDGSHLQVYQGGQQATGTLSGSAVQATGTLTGTSNVAEGDTIEINGIYYKWSATVVDGAGSAGSPWVVLLGVSLQESLVNMAAAIMASGTPGTTYSTSLTAANSDVTATSTTTTLDLTAIVYGSTGNAITTTVVTGVTISWGAATLTGGASTNVAEGDTIQIGSSYFKWSATVVNGNGSASSPWVVLLGADLTTSLATLVKCISFTGVAGTDYSANLAGQNSEVTVTSDASKVYVTAISDLADGNLIATVVDVGASLSFGAATLTGGGVHGLSGVAMPNGEPPGSLAVLKSYVIICIVGQGKFYFLQPGSIVINALDYATAETKPDATFDVLVQGDTLLFVGQDSTEVWYPTTDANQPFKAVSGRSSNIGAIEGTAVNVKGEVFLVGSDFNVYAVSGSPRPVSDNGIAELIRKTIVG